MRKVIFSLAVIVFIVLVLIFVLPYVMGAALKSQVYSLAKSNNLPGDVKIKVVNYKVGWITSKMNLEVLVPQHNALSNIFHTPNEMKIPKDLILDVDLNVEHGPFAHLKHSVTNKSWLWGRGVASGTVTLDQKNWSTAFKKTLSQFPIAQEPFTVQVWGHWGGAMTIDLVKNPGVLFVNKNPKITVTHGHFDEVIQLSRKFDHIKVDMQVKKIMATNSIGTITAATLEGKADLKRGSENFWYGPQSLSIPTISWVKAGQSLAQIQGVEFSVAQALDANKNIKGYANFDIAKFTALGNELGPFKYHLSFKNLRPEAAVALRNECEKLSKQKWPAAPKNATAKQLDDFQNAQFLKIFKMLQPKMVEVLTGVTVNLDTLQLQTPQGLVKLTATGTFPDQINGSVSDPKALQNLAIAATAKAKLLFPVALSNTLIELASPYLDEQHAADKKAAGNKASQKSEKPQQSPQQIINQLVKQGYIHKVNGHYVVNLSYKKQALTINGKGWMELINEEFKSNPSWRATSKKLKPSGQQKASVKQKTTASKKEVTSDSQ